MPIFSEASVSSWKSTASGSSLARHTFACAHASLAAPRGAHAPRHKPACRTFDENGMSCWRNHHDCMLRLPHVATPNCDTTKSHHQVHMLAHGWDTHSSTRSISARALCSHKQLAPGPPFAVGGSGGEAALPRPCPSGRCARRTAAALSTAWTGSPLAPAGLAAAVPVVQVACVCACLCVCV